MTGDEVLASVVVAAVVWWACTAGWPTVARWREGRRRVRWLAAEAGTGASSTATRRRLGGAWPLPVRPRETDAPWWSGGPWARSGLSWPGVGRELWCLPGGLLLAVVGGSVLPVLASLGAVFVVRRVLAARQAARARDRRAAAVITLCATVATELRAGRQPNRALLAAGVPELGDAGSAILAAARYGGDVPRALRAAAVLPGADGLNGVAACWRVAVEGGAGLAAGLERIAAALRSGRDQRDELNAQLAGPRATALMLALLPACGLLMGTALGADPLRVLLHTPFGWVCLAIGGLLEWAGVAWTARIVAGALPPTGERQGGGRRRVASADRPTGRRAGARCGLTPEGAAPSARRTEGVPV
ncbi:type II secretion system F family protein [Streptomyces catenulae]|uniref:Type II secretion system F family protein n=1 Tax=Streptomyces catenulae TaxID=66875 RepID=A0ABV2Z8L1_9ACTN|nr:type II secretion system F family protein [Streptomyces catenulae]